MGFSITTCILTAIMFISYCVALADLNQILRCRQDNWDYDYESTYHTNTYCYSNSYRHAAAVGAGIGSCMLIFALVEFILALASSIYCCNAVCCNTPGVVGTTVSVLSCIKKHNKIILCFFMHETCQPFNTLIYIIIIPECCACEKW